MPDPTDDPSPTAHAGGAPDPVRAGLCAAVARRRSGATEPTDAAIDDAVDLLERREEGWTVRLRPPGTELLVGRRSRGSVVDVVGDDRPLIVDSLEAALRAQGLGVVDILAVACGVDREGGALRAIGPARAASHTEVVTQVELDRHLDDGAGASLVRDIEALLDRLVVVTDDADAMRQRLLSATVGLAGSAATGAVPGDGVDDAVRTLRWLLDGNAVLLGLARRAAGADAPPEGAPDLGLLRTDPPQDPGPPPRPPVGPDAPLRITRLAALSPLARRDPMLRLDVWTPDAGPDGAAETLLWVAAHRAAGAPLTSVPVLRRKLDDLLARRDVVPGSYDEQHLTLLFQSLPEDDLFSLDADDLDTLLGEMLAEDHDAGVRVALRPIADAHSIAALVTVPVDRWTRPLRQRLERFLAVQLDGEHVDVSLSFTTGTAAVTARLVVDVDPDSPLPTGLDSVAREVRLLCRSWEEELQAALVATADDAPAGEAAEVVAPRWAARLPESFRDTVPARDAVDDVRALERLAPSGEAGATSPAAGPRAEVWFGSPRRPEEPERLCLAVDHPIELSALLPALESLGLWVTEEARWDAGDGLSLHQLGVRVRPSAGPAGSESPRLLADREATARVAAAVVALVLGPAEVDGLNRLVLHARMPWQDVAVLRAYRRYRHQIDPRHDASYVDDVLVAHPELARGLAALWHARFDPTDDLDARELRSDEAARAVHEGCDALTRLDHDRILRGIAGTIEATLRTNRHLAPGGPLALKIDPSRVPGCPHPRPYREIFVTGPSVEGEHLRAGPVARGGIRASDREQDHRAEVLDLMRAQVLKNAVIVPTGAKGAFVLRGDPGPTPGDPAAAHRERVAEAYDAFVGALLDVTDDIEGDDVVAVPGRWDGDDPYLVVAADKGTAAFSDRANDLAEARGYWLGDAFASGGSKGYDHKALGITARGAWVAIERHLRALGIDLRKDEITVAGVGDMSGDVFGNGMLHSDRIRLVAAFDHRHVFLDPSPDPAASWAERRRLFDTPRSCWADYDPALISDGGGVHERTAKEVTLSRQARDVLRVSDAALTPAALVRAVLCAPVDLLYFGGIGTYVRASTEDDGSLDDRANAEVRVVARDLRARVVGEGANLAMTQRARVEVARRGTRINVDAIDNAAGVDSSDHEVNLKVLLALAEREGRIERDERDRILAAHVDDVVDAVLEDCASQADALDRAERSSPEGILATAALMAHLVEAEVLDPEVEALPSPSEVENRMVAGAGFTRPELAVLLAGMKRWVAAEVLASDAPDDEVVRDALTGYFPPALAARFDDLVDQHRLRRDLIASEVANDLVDHLGATTVLGLVDELRVEVPEIALAYWVARGIVRGPERWRGLADGAEEVDPTSSGDPVDGGSLLAVVLLSLTRAELVRRRSDRRAGRTWDPAARIAEDRPVADALLAHLAAGEDEDERRREEREALARRLAAGGLEPSAARAAALLPDLEVVHDVAAVSRDLDCDPVRVARAFWAVERHLGIDGLQDRIDALPVDDEWATSARQGLLDDLAGLRREAACRALAAAGPDDDPEAAVGSLLADSTAGVSEAREVRRRLAAEREPGLDALTVAVRAARRAVL